jgi:hypothetical protein
MNRLAFVCVAAVTLMAQGRQGIRPRPNASDYPAHEAIAGTTIAAVVLSPDEVRNLFATDLHKAAISWSRSGSTRKVARTSISHRAILF